MATTFLYDVFLSHNSNDKPRVRHLAERLRDEGLRVWLDAWIVKPGDDIYLTIERGLEASRVQVLCLSPAALSSDWVAMERSTVLFRDPGNAGRRFIPLLLEDCTLPDTLRRYKYVDFRGETEAAFEELLIACRPDTESTPPTASRPLAMSSPGKIQGPKLLAVLERELTGHQDWVNDVVVSPDSTWAVSGSSDSTVRLWDLATGECRRILREPSNLVRSVAITPDGRHVLAGSFDQRARVWSVETGSKITTFYGHDGSSKVIALQDNVHALSSGSDATLKLWKLESGECVKTIKWDEVSVGTVFSLAVDPTGSRALSGHSGGQIILWDLENGKISAILKGHSNIVNSIQISPDGRIAASGSKDATIKLWDLDAQSCIGTLEGHKTEVTSVAISFDGRLIASTGFVDETVRLWDVQSGACVHVIELQRSIFPYSVAFSPDGSRLVVGLADTPGHILVYRLTENAPIARAPETRRYVNAKVVLLGEGTVGKTSLAHRLVEDRYVVRDRTHGMNVWPLELPLPADTSLEREVLLWDLAGQEDYRLIHQLFLDETALALLLINPQREDPFAEAGDWLKALQTASGNSEAPRDVAKLLIFSQIDVGGMKLGNAKIERFREEHGFAGWMPTSAKTGENCSDGLSGGRPSPLKQLVADSIPWRSLPFTSTLRPLAVLKDAVMTMRSQTDIRLLRFAELEQRLKQMLPNEQFDESDVRTAVKLLANLGLSRPLKFGDLVLLQPDLLNGYAGAIIRAARAHTDEIGCVSEAALYRPDFDFTGVERLKHHSDEELLLRALVQTFLDKSLCIAEETPEGRLLVFPSQYRREKDIPREPDTFVSYTFRGEWQTVWTTLVVRLWYSQEFEHRELWRNAAEFQSSKGHLLGLMIKNRQGEGEATISLFFDVKTPDELKVIFIEYVHRHLARYAIGVTRDRRYICECGKPVRDLEAVRRRFTAGKDFIICQECDQHVPLIDFIEQRLKSDPVARRILAMEETATRQLGTQALEQILIGHMMAVCGEANQIFRPWNLFHYGIDGEVEFKDNDGRASGRKIYVQLKSGTSYLRHRERDGSEIFDVKDERHLAYWVSQPVDVYLVICQTDEQSGQETIRWMNVTSYLKGREDRSSPQIRFDGQKLDMEAVWRVRDAFFPPGQRH